MKPSEKNRPGEKPALPRVVILATGGTIAGSGESATGAGYSSGKMGVDAMIDADRKSVV